MGGFGAHYRDHSAVYPATSLAVGALVYGLTANALVMMATVLAGYALLVVGLVIPDVDSTQSVVHRTVDRVVTAVLGLLIAYWVVVSDVGPSASLAVGLGAALRPLPDGLVLVALVALLVVWWGYNSPHRGLPHRVSWSAGLALLVALGAWFGLAGWHPADRLAVGTGLAVHFFVGAVAHLDRDGVLFGDGPSFR